MWPTVIQFAGSAIAQNKKPAPLLRGWHLYARIESEFWPYVKVYMRQLSKIIA
jgi:hypothetical protein